MTQNNNINNNNTNNTNNDTNNASPPALGVLVDEGAMIALKAAVASLGRAEVELRAAQARAEVACEQAKKEADGLRARTGWTTRLVAGGVGAAVGAAAGAVVTYFVMRQPVGGA